MREIDPDFSEICFVGGGLTEFNAKRFGPDVRRLDVSFNAINKITGLESFSENLEELVLDNNQITELELNTTFPKLHTLSLNKNKISNLKRLIEDLKPKVPNIRFLSLLGNPSCPDQLSDDFVDDSDYQIYRYHILHHFRTLKFLDHRPVSSSEMAEACKTLYRNLQLYPTTTPLPSSSSSDTSTKAIKGGTQKNRQGKRRYKYIGKNSEGNIFIRDGDL